MMFKLIRRITVALEQIAGSLEVIQTILAHREDREIDCLPEEPISP